MNPDLPGLIGAFRRQDDERDALVASVHQATSPRVLPDNALERLNRIMNGVGTHADLEWSRDRWRNFIVGAGACAFERAFHLPSTSRPWALYARDHWLREAARYVGTGSKRARAQALAAALARFVECRWPILRHSLHPPNTSPLEGALFCAVRESVHGQVSPVIKWRRLYSIIEVCATDSPSDDTPEAGKSSMQIGSPA